MDLPWFKLGELARGVGYYVRVKAYNAVGPSAWSNVGAIVTPVTGVKAESISESQIDVTWDPADQATAAEVVIERRRLSDNNALDRSEPVTEFQEVEAVPATEGTYSDNGLAEGTRYEYRVRVRVAETYSAAGTSGYWWWGYHLGAATKPAAPTGLAAATGPGLGQPPGGRPARPISLFPATARSPVPRSPPPPRHGN